MSTPSPLDHVCSKNHVPEGFIPFGLCLIFLFFETLKQTKNSNSNLLTGGPTQNCCFCLFQSFAEKEYQTESKRNETFGNVIFGTNVIQRTWSLRKEINEEGTRQGGAPTPLGVPSTLVTASIVP